MMPSGSARRTEYASPSQGSSLHPLRLRSERQPRAHDESGNRTKVQPAAHKAAFTVRRIFGDKIDAPVYSPPTEKPCAILQINSRIGAHIPIVAYDGIRPIQNVLIDMMTMVAGFSGDHIYHPACRRKDHQEGESGRERRTYPARQSSASWDRHRGRTLYQVHRPQSRKHQNRTTPSHYRARPL